MNRRYIVAYNTSWGGIYIKIFLNIVMRDAFVDGLRAVGASYCTTEVYC